jgi:hypothetical protein
MSTIGTLITLFLGFIVFAILIPQDNRRFAVQVARDMWRSFKSFNSELGGYVHDTAMSQYIPPTTFLCITGTWTEAAGAVAGTIAKHKAANAETSDVYIPITVPSNSAASKGAYLKSIEVDYEVAGANATSITASLNKVVRGADGADATVSNPTITQDLTAGTDAADIDEHKLTVTLSTPVWIDNDHYYMLRLACVCAANTTLDMLAAVANYTLRV